MQCGLQFCSNLISLFYTAFFSSFSQKQSALPVWKTGSVYCCHKIRNRLFCFPAGPGSLRCRTLCRFRCTESPVCSPEISCGSHHRAQGIFQAVSMSRIQEFPVQRYQAYITLRSSQRQNNCAPQSVQNAYLPKPVRSAHLTAFFFSSPEVLLLPFHHHLELRLIQPHAAASDSAGAGRILFPSESWTADRKSCIFPKRVSCQVYSILYVSILAAADSF